MRTEAENHPAAQRNAYDSFSVIGNEYGQEYGLPLLEMHMWSVSNLTEIQVP